jgi:GNAT superfamily N-acetyltransferase
VDVVRGLQERAARAFPAEQVTELGGWWLRHAPNCPWWVGTVLPHGDTGDLATRVTSAERFYAGHSTSARFQICPGACPDGLDTVLAGRGYRLENLMSLQVAPTVHVLARSRAGSPHVRVDDRPTPDWVDVWHEVHGNGDTRPEWDLLARVAQPSAYASAMIGDEVVAVGRAVADTGWAGLFGMATLPEVRGRGAARAVLAALADWADTHGAAQMYLQAERDNVLALRLYGSAGFREIRGYHYRHAA